MQAYSMAAKAKVFIDGNEIPGLVSVNEIKLEKTMVDVPSFKRIRQISADITKLPAIELKYEIERNTNTLSFFRNYYNQNEIHDIIVSRTDAHGDEFERITWQSCECVSMTDAPYDAASPTYASITITLIPWERL